MQQLTQGSYSWEDIGEEPLRCYSVSMARRADAKFANELDFVALPDFIHDPRYTGDYGLLRNHSAMGDETDLWWEAILWLSAPGRRTEYANDALAGRSAVMA